MRRLNTNRIYNLSLSFVLSFLVLFFSLFLLNGFTFNLSSFSCAGVHSSIHTLRKKKSDPYFFCLYICLPLKKPHFLSGKLPFQISHKEENRQSIHLHIYAHCVILTTMGPLFQMFVHSLSLWFSVDLPGQESQRAWSMSLPAVLNSKGMTPFSFFFSSALSLLSPSGGKM